MTCLHQALVFVAHGDNPACHTTCDIRRSARSIADWEFISVEEHAAFGWLTELCHSLAVPEGFLEVQIPADASAKH
jgi:hypothetical protein